MRRCRPTASSCRSSRSTADHTRIRDDVTGDPQQVILFVQRCAEAFGLTGRWGFQWANACSRPRVNAFGGGAHVLDLETRETIAWTDTNG